MEKKLIQLLLLKEFWEQHKGRVIRTMFPEELASVYDTIVNAHEKYGRSISFDEMKALYRINNPTMTRTARNSIEELFVDIEHEPPIGIDVAHDVLSHMWQSETGRRIADIGVKIMEHTESSLEPLVTLIERTRDDFLPVEETAAVTDDIDSILDDEDAAGKWRFNIREVSRRIPGVSPGDFAVIFARPETGKTASWVSFAAGPDGWARQGARVHAIVNEEKGTRTKLRLASAWTGMTKEEMFADRDKMRALWASARGRIVMRDDDTYTMDRLEMYAKRHRPDVLVIDQLDKISVSGSFARDDQRLREVYLRARSIGKRYDCAVFGISQASADAEGKTRLHYSMMESSKTGKAAEADLIMGIGKHPLQEGQDEEDDTRFITLSKNKISGWHGVVICHLDGKLSRFID